MGAAQSFKEMGDMVGPLAIGLLTQLFSVRVGFATCGALALVCLLFLARVGALDLALSSEAPVPMMRPPAGSDEDETTTRVSDDGVRSVIRRILLDSGMALRSPCLSQFVQSTCPRRLR